MKAVFAIALLGLVASAAAADCSKAQVTACATAYSKCYSGHLQDHCVCWPAYFTCFQNAGCPPSAVGGLKDACHYSGCPATDCGGAVEIANSCNSTAIAGCAHKVATCIQHDPQGYCACEGELVACYEDISCPSSVISAAESACERVGCSSSQCAPSDMYRNLREAGLWL